MTKYIVMIKKPSIVGTMQVSGSRLCGALDDWTGKGFKVLGIAKKGKTVHMVKRAVM